jgi:proline iminopeptidase
VAAVAALTSCQADESAVQLWPEIEPFESGFLSVLCGNRDGKPVFMLHGGPGSGSSPYMRRFCDPEKFLIVIHDQRGAGKSKPYADVRENTTQHLVEDIEHIRTKFGLGKIILFGGSWGSTLALAYAETYPDNVSGLVLRGVFAATQAEIDHFYHGGTRLLFPENYDQLLDALPDPDRRPLPEYLLELIQNGTESDKKKYSLAWAIYETKIAALDIPDHIVRQIYDDHDPYAFALLESYYMANGCFLEEGQLIENAYKISGIPVFMVNGRYDVICPPITAFRLHKLLPKSELVIAEGAGHWMGEPPIERALLTAMKKFE